MDDMQIVEFNNEQDCCEDLPEVREHEFAEVMQNVGGDEICRIVERQFTPFVGQEFNDIEEAVKFCKMYTLACGFNVLRYTTKKWHDGAVKSKLLVCNREGFTYAKKLKTDVDGSLIRAVWADGIARRNYSVFGDAVSFDPTYSTNKYDMVFTPFTGIDNHKRSINFCGALLFRENEDYFDWVFKRFLVAMGEKEPKYIITDQDPGIIKTVKNVFKTARHRFCMWHIMNKVPVKYGCKTKDYPEFIKKLNAIIWDDELEPDEFDSRWGEIMKEHAVGKSAWFEEVYLKRRQWVMAHCRGLNMGSVMRTIQRSESENSFFKKFENNNGTLVEFWMHFESAIDQQRYTQKKTDNDNKHTSPKMVTQCPIERHGARVYTHATFNEFQEKVKMSTNGLGARGFTEGNEIELTKLQLKIIRVTRSTVYSYILSILRLHRVSLKIATQAYCRTYEATWSCRMFERAGILCRHIIWIYSSNGVQSIPESYVVQRWRMDALYSASDGKEVIDGKQIEITRLCSEIHETVGVLRGKAKDDIETLSNLIRDFREKLSPSTEELTKQQEIEQLLGCKASKEITILPPKHAKNKGSGKRMLSTKTKAEALLSKPKRICNNCKQMAHHDKRNSHNPFAERPQPPIESSSDEDEDEEEDDESSE
ncbi:protein FAR1-RELATED SEQUENCE 9-like [Silene latifolia]|uniref:protein FAR1-RELATED SEQUENCE 9-like n=1 Tax=Silene latifolia TaxID=37657 RepID=UPI003D777780